MNNKNEKYIRKQIKVNKQIKNLGCDEAKNEPLLKGLLSPDSNLFDQILP